MYMNDVYSFIWVFIAHVLYITEVQSTYVKQNAYLGQTTRLSCNTETQGSVNWRFRPTASSSDKNLVTGGKAVESPEGKYSLNANVKGDFALVVNNLQFVDSGFYTCTDTSGSGQSLTVKLEVTSKPKYAVGVVNETVTLKCHTGLNASAVWKHKTDEKTAVLDFSKDEKFERESPAAGDHDLVINNITLSDAGKYVCDETGPAEVIYILTVKETKDPKPREDKFTDSLFGLSILLLIPLVIAIIVIIVFACLRKFDTPCACIEQGPTYEKA